MVVVIVAIAPAAVVAVTFAIPVVAMFETAAVTFPVAVVIAFTVVARTDPTSASVGRTSPVTLMPAVVMSHRIPIAVDPDIFGAWLTRVFVIGARRRRCADPDADGNLSGCRVRHEEAQCRNDGYQADSG